MTRWKRKFKRALTSSWMARVVLKIVWLILKTCRIEIHGLDEFLTAAKKDKRMLMFWHNRLTIVPYLLLKYTEEQTFTAVVSNSRDGNLLASIIGKYPKKGSAIRVDHRHRHQALRDMIKSLQSGKVILITPDGPRGPRYHIKPGAIFSAQATKASIVPLTWSATRFWQLGSWDKMIIPKPFSRIRVSFGDPIAVPHAKREQLADQAAHVENLLLQLDQDNCHQLSADPATFPR